MSDAGRQPDRGDAPDVPRSPDPLHSLDPLLSPGGIADRRSGATTPRAPGPDSVKAEERGTPVERRAGRSTRGGPPSSPFASRRRIFITVGLVVIVLAVVIAVILDQTHGDGGTLLQNTSGSSLGAGSSPYEMAEAPATAELKAVEGAKFVSIAIETAPGKLTSYMLDSSLPSMQALETAVLNAKEDDAIVDSGGSTLTFVSSSRLTVTFDLDLDQGLIGRGGKTWRPQGDLKALITNATTSST